MSSDPIRKKQALTAVSDRVCVILSLLSESSRSGVPAPGGERAGLQTNSVSHVPKLETTVGKCDVSIARSAVGFRRRQTNAGDWDGIGSTLIAVSRPWRLLCRAPFVSS